MGWGNKNLGHMINIASMPLYGKTSADDLDIVYAALGTQALQSLS